GTTLGFEPVTSRSFAYELDTCYDEPGLLTLNSPDTPSAGTTITGAMKYTLAHYHIESKPHTIDRVIDSQLGAREYTYNASGSVEKLSVGGEEREGFFWNEEQWLMGVRNANGVHHYIYDQNGERIMKSSVTIDQFEVNGENINEVANLAPYTL